MKRLFNFTCCKAVNTGTLFTGKALIVEIKTASDNKNSYMMN
jgi:hypothetical protein